jgi:hypothetical protein
MGSPYATYWESVASVDPMTPEELKAMVESIVARFAHQEGEAK